MSQFLTGTLYLTLLTLLLISLAGSTFFSRLYLQKGYYQNHMASKDIPKTAIVTSFRMFKFLHLPFGLQNSGNTFQGMMDQILGNLPYCFVYMDDVLVFSPNLSSHVSATPRHPGAVLFPCPDNWPGKM